MKFKITLRLHVIKKMTDYRLHPITWKNVIDYNWLQLQITITPCLVVMHLCVRGIDFVSFYNFDIWFFRLKNTNKPEICNVRFCVQSPKSLKFVCGKYFHIIMTISIQLKINNTTLNTVETFRKNQISKL
jgi:hypothetical protein